MDLLLLIRCFLLVPLFVGVGVCSLFCKSVLGVISSFAITLMGKRERESSLLCFNCLPNVL